MTVDRRSTLNCPLSQFKGAGALLALAVDALSALALLLGAFHQGDSSDGECHIWTGRRPTRWD